MEEGHWESDHTEVMILHAVMFWTQATHRIVPSTFSPLDTYMVTWVLDLLRCTKTLKITQNLASSHLPATSLFSLPSV